MIYQRRYTPRTTLIARQGYSGYESTGDSALKPDGTSCASPQVYNVFYDSCVDPCPSGQSYNASGICAAGGGASSSSSGGGILSSVAQFLGGAASAFRPQVQVASTTPSWILPVAIGGVALVAVILLTGPKRAPAPASNPGRRRRRRRNPAGLTKKGERMYRHIRNRYGSDPRAKEIAARTVYARAKRQKGLVRKY